jgi:hypothetical protein
VERSGRRAAAVLSLLAGLLGLPSMIGDPAFGLLFGLLAVVTGSLAVKGRWRGIAVTGVVLGIVTLAGFAWFVFMVSQNVDPLTG